MKNKNTLSIWMEWKEGIRVSYVQIWVQFMLKCMTNELIFSDLEWSKKFYADEVIIIMWKSIWGFAHDCNGIAVATIVHGAFKQIWAGEWLRLSFSFLWASKAL